MKDTAMNGQLVGVIGLGYVGLPLALLFASAGHRVLGIDVDTTRVNSVNAGVSYVEDVASADIARAVGQSALSATTSYDRVPDLDAVIICVPTPLDAHQQPDVTAIIAAVAELAPHLRPGALVVLESSSYPGTTEELVLPAIEATGRKVGRDFHLAYSPERVNPGSGTPLQRIAKLVAGVTPACTDAAMALYGTVFEQLVRVSTPRVAELAKLVENTHRLINISFVNEMAVHARRLDVDVWEVLAAAATKPFGYEPHYPGPGIGGHCIPVDPLYLQWSLQRAGAESLLIEAAHRVNEAMPEHIAFRLQELLGSLQGKQLLLLGVAYKRNIGDTRESPALPLWDRLEAAGARVFYHDPHVPTLRRGPATNQSQPLTAALLRAMDAVVVVTDHGAVDYHLVAREAPLVLDTRNALAAWQRLGHIRRL